MILFIEPSTRSLLAFLCKLTVLGREFNVCNSTKISGQVSLSLNFIRGGEVFLTPNLNVYVRGTPLLLGLLCYTFFVYDCFPLSLFE